MPRPIPLEQALKELDSPEAVADRRKRAKAWAETLEGDARGAMFARAHWEDLERIRQPFRTQERLYGAELAAAERAAGKIADAVILKACEIDLRDQMSGQFEMTRSGRPSRSAGTRTPTKSPRWPGRQATRKPHSSLDSRR